MGKSLTRDQRKNNRYISRDQKRKNKYDNYIIDDSEFIKKKSKSKKVF